MLEPTRERDRTGGRRSPQVVRSPVAEVPDDHRARCPVTDRAPTPATWRCEALFNVRDLGGYDDRRRSLDPMADALPGRRDQPGRRGRPRAAARPRAAHRARPAHPRRARGAGPLPGRATPRSPTTTSRCSARRGRDGTTRPRRRSGVVPGAALRGDARRRRSRPGRRARGAGRPGEPTRRSSTARRARTAPACSPPSCWACSGSTTTPSPPTTASARRPWCALVDWVRANGPRRSTP